MPKLDLLGHIDHVLARLRAHEDAFEVTYRAKPPATAAALQAVERKLGIALPAALRALYLKHGGVMLSWRARRGHEERLEGDHDDPPGGYLDIVPPSGLGRRLKEHGVVQLTGDGGGNGWALPARGAPKMLWFDHDPVDGEHVQAGGLGNLDAWFAAWAKIGFGDFRSESDAVVAFLRTGKLKAGEPEPTAKLQKSARGKAKDVLEAAAHKEHVWAVAALPDGLRGVSGSNDGVLHVFELATGKKLAKLHAGSTVYALAAHPDGKRIVCGHRQGFDVWDLSKGKQTKASNPRAGRIFDLALTPDGKRVVTIGPFELAAWDLTTGKKLTAIEADGDSVRVDSRGRAVVLSDDSTLRIWDLAKKRVERTVRHAKMPAASSSASLALDRATDTAIVVDPRPMLARFSTKTGAWLTPPVSGKAKAMLPRPALSPDGRMLLMNGTGAGVTFEAWDTVTGKRLFAPVLPKRFGITSIAVTPDGKRAILGSAFGWVLVCDLAAVAQRQPTSAS
jgi:WD40 repeat protein